MDVKREERHGHREEKRRVFLEIMRQLEHLVLRQQQQPRNPEPAPPTHPPPQQRKTENPARREERRTPSPEHHERLLPVRQAERFFCKPGRPEHQQRVMEIPLPRNDLIHLVPLVGMMEKRETVLSRVQPERRSEEQGRAQRQKQDLAASREFGGGGTQSFMLWVFRFRIRTPLLRGDFPNVHD